MSTCPTCGSDRVHRSRTRSKWEEWRKEITGRRPYRCHACGWRGWIIDAGLTFTEEERLAAERVLAPEAPNLKGTALSRDKTPKELDLELLDTTKRSDEG